MNRNFAIVLGFGAFVVLILALLLKKGPTSYQLGDIGSKLTLPSLGGADEATVKSAIGATLKALDPKPTAPTYDGRGQAAYSSALNAYQANLAAWNARNP